MPEEARLAAPHSRTYAELDSRVLELERRLADLEMAHDVAVSRLTRLQLAIKNFFDSAMSLLEVVRTPWF